MGTLAKNRRADGSLRPLAFVPVTIVVDDPFGCLADDFDGWLGQVEELTMRLSGQRLRDLAEVPPLAECHAIGMTALEVYLWYVRRPEWPAGDVSDPHARA
jgi:hypothetical protein